MEKVISMGISEGGGQFENGHKDARPIGIGNSGRHIYGPTPPSKAVPCARISPLSESEIDSVVNIIAMARVERRAAILPEPLRTRDWSSVVEVILQLDKKLGLPGVGWKVGAASKEVRRAEKLPSPSPGRIYEGTIFPSGVELGPEMFINYRNVECEFAFLLGLDYPARPSAYSEADVRVGVEALFPALELGDTVFLDWYGASGYFGTCLDNGGGAGLVIGTKLHDWLDIDLVESKVDLFLNGFYIKSGQGSAAMGHPVTSLTWMINWASSQGRAIEAGEVISTGTCTGHCFTASGDSVRADFGLLGCVEVNFA